MFKYRKGLSISLLTCLTLFSSLAEADVPNAPGNYVGVSKLSDTSVRISTKDNSDNENGFYASIYDYATSTLVQRKEISASNSSTIYVNFTGLVCDKLYGANVIAFNEDGNSSASDTRYFNLHSTFSTTCPDDKEIPNAPGAYIGVTDINKSAVRINFLDNSDNEDGFLLFDESGDINVTVPANNATAPSQTYVTLTGLTANRTYTIKALAFNTSGNSTISNTRTFNIHTTFGIDFDEKNTTKNLEGNVSLTIEKVDKQTNEAKVHIVTDINEADYVFDNNKSISMDEGTVQDGYITLHSGRHHIKVCSDEPGTICSFEHGILVSHNVDAEVYKKYDIEVPSYGLTNNGTELVYAGADANIYTYDLSLKSSTFLVSNGNRRSNGLAYVNGATYYFSEKYGGTIRKINTLTGSIDTLARTNFPDGLDVFNNKIYAVTNDRNNILSIFDLDGEKIGTLVTDVPDITGITHTRKYLYILSEDANIFQVNPTTGETNRIFTNDNLFTRGNNNSGLEAITILNNYIYVSYVNDVSIYKIDINLNDYE